jgi:hypothetical protein
MVTNSHRCGSGFPAWIPPLWVTQILDAQNLPEYEARHFGGAWCKPEDEFFFKIFSKVRGSKKASSFLLILSGKSLEVILRGRSRSFGSLKKEQINLSRTSSDRLPMVNERG